jgi:hypothetical protein
MSKTESYRDRTFIVEDADARIRKPDSLMEFERYAEGDALPAGAKLGDFKRIPKDTEIKIDEVRRADTGSKGSIIFGHALSADGGTMFGWTSTRNLRGKFINETLGSLEPAPGASQTGPNAAWSHGAFLRQITLVNIVDARLELERIALDTLDAYQGLVSAAAGNGVRVVINSGFRSFPEQKVLFEGFKAGLPGFNKAAPPGSSNHQSGIAFDIAVGGGDGDPTYEWLKRNAPERGFVRTVNGEPWHWEFDPPKAAAALAAHTFKTSNVSV